MKEFETKHGAVKVTCGVDRVYLRTSSYGPINQPAPRLIEGQRVRLSIDEARIVGKAILRGVAEAEEHLERQKQFDLNRKARAAENAEAQTRWEMTKDGPPAYRPDMERMAQVLAKRREEEETKVRELLASRRRGPKRKAAIKAVDDILSAGPLDQKPREPLN